MEDNTSAKFEFLASFILPNGILDWFAFVKANGYFEYRRNEQAKYWMYESINEHLRDSFYNNEKIISMLAAKEEEVLNGKLTSFVAAKKLLDAYFSTLK